MADSFFEVKYGLKVGNTTIYAANGDVTTTGNVTVTGGNVAVSAIQNGNSNVAVAANSNVTVSVAGNANIVTVTGTGANISGTANVTGNLSAGNVNAPTFGVHTGNVTTTGNVTAGNITISGDTISSANTTITIDPSTAGVGGLVVIAGNLQVDGTTTTVNSTTLDVTDLNITVAKGAANPAAANGAGITVDGASASMTYNSTSNTFVFTHGANITGTANVSGNANVGNLGTSTVIATTANLTTINSGLMQNGNSNVTITANSNVTIAVTAANSYTFAPGSFAPNGNGAQQLGLTGARWSNIWGLASSAQYADLAERYDAGVYIEPGTVVEFGGDHEVQICGTQMSTKVAGVISTAPGYLMNDTEDKGDNWVPVAFTGRVPTKVVGPVAKGDIMVSAGNGHAMSCAAPIIGSVIGKALENFDAGEGVIEVVIGRF